MVNEETDPPSYSAIYLIDKNIHLENSVPKYTDLFQAATSTSDSLNLTTTNENSSNYFLAYNQRQNLDYYTNQQRERLRTIRFDEANDDCGYFSFLRCIFMYIFLIILIFFVRLILKELEFSKY